MSIIDIPTYESETPNGTSESPTVSAEALGQAISHRPGDGPTMTPPSETAALVGDDVGVTAWHNNQKITAMWCNSAPRNAFASVEGMGWKRLSSASDSSFVTLVALLSHAEQSNANCRLRIEADKIVEAYVF